MKIQTIFPKRLGLTFFFLFVLLLHQACKDEENPVDTELEVVESIQVQLNPSGFAPLSAQVNLSTRGDVAVRIRVIGQRGSDSDVVHTFPQSGNSFTLPVLGLYPNTLNQVELIFLDGLGNEIATESLEIQTGPLISEMPSVRIDVPDGGAAKPGMNLVNYFGHSGTFLPQRPFVFDKFGDIRWYIDFTAHPTLSSLFFDNGMERLQNGNFIFGDGNSAALYEINMLGEVVNTWSLQNYTFHHHVREKPNGNFLVTVNKNGLPTVEDFIIEIDRNSGGIVREWDLNVSLDNTRRAWPTTRADLNIDWFHGNAIEFSPRDNSIIVSGRTQGTVKLSSNNQVIWILAPHRGWFTSGRGEDLKQFLLQPLDAQGNAISDSLVLDGAENHPEFEWAWYQHSPIILPNGNLMLFDNGDNRNYTVGSEYSRAVEYKIDESQKTIQQIWTYGKERGGEIKSSIVSKVIYYEDVDHVLYTPGAVRFGGEDYGKVLEIDRLSGDVVFEATVSPPIAPFGITFHNVHRMRLYP